MAHDAKQPALARLRAGLAAFDARIDRLARRWEEADEDVPAALSDRLRAVRHRRDTLRNKIERILRAPGRGPPASRRDAERALARLQQAWDVLCAHAPDGLCPDDAASPAGRSAGDGPRG